MGVIFLTSSTCSSRRRRAWKSRGLCRRKPGAQRGGPRSVSSPGPPRPPPRPGVRPAHCGAAARFLQEDAPAAPALRLPEAPGTSRFSPASSRGSDPGPAGPCRRVELDPERGKCGRRARPGGPSTWGPGGGPRPPSGREDADRAGEPGGSAVRCRLAPQAERGDGSAGAGRRRAPGLCQPAR